MATVAPSVQNLNVSWGVPDSPAIIIDLVKQSGTLQSALVAKSSHGNKHKYKYHDALPANGGFRAMGTGIVPSVIGLNQLSNDLWEYSDFMQVDASEAREYNGGKNQWFADNYPAFLEAAGQAITKQIYYGTNTTFGSTSGFVGFHQYTKANSTVTAQLSGSTGSRSSLFAVRWDTNNGCSLRYGASGGQLIEVIDMTPGLPVTNTTNTTTGAIAASIPVVD